MTCRVPTDIIYLAAFLLLVASGGQCAMAQSQGTTADLNEKLQAAFENTRAINRLLPTTRGGFTVVPEAAPFVDISENDAILFERNADILHEGARPCLDRIGELLRDGPLKNNNVQIEGHTCSLGLDEFNQSLSLRRAQNVSSYLIDNYGIQESRIRTVGYGESRSVSNNLSEDSRCVNRRVRIVSLENSSSGGVATFDEVSQAKTRAISAGNAEKLVQVDFLGRMSQTDRLRPLTTGSALPSGGTFKARVKVFEGCHMYMLAACASGKIDFLHPDAQDDNIVNGRWIDRTQEGDNDNSLIELPERNRSYLLDETTGTETIFVLASRSPVSSLQDLASIVQKALNTDEIPDTLPGYAGEVYSVQINHVTRSQMEEMSYHE